jgi:glycosyltransferase involved in cell wall biosynthesis
MRRVLIFSLAYYPHVGGAEVAIKEITDRIPGVEFHMLTLNFGGEAKEERIGNVLVHRVGNSASYLSKILFVPRAACIARRLHRAHHFDAVWVMMSYMLFPTVLLRWLGVQLPYLLSLQEGDPFEHVFNRLRIAPFRPLLRRGFREAAAVQAISTFLAEWARQVGFPGTPVVIGNGVDTARFSREFSYREIDAMKEKLGKKRTDAYLVTTSRLVKKNAVDDVIRSLRFLPENVQFIVYGIGPEEADLRRLAERTGVASRVRFMGHLEHADMPLALKACDIFVRPSRSEGMGNSFVEAMAAGLPVIGTQEGGIADFLFDVKRNPDREATGWVVDKDSPRQIASAANDILANPDRAMRVIRSAQAYIAERYDWDSITARMNQVFDRVIQNG